MKFIDRIKAGAKVAPVFSIVLYYLFRILDNYTTYLASPDLKYEGNWFIRYFHLSWGEIIIKDSLIALSLTLVLLIALDYIHKNFQEHLAYRHSFIVEVFKQKKLLLCIVILCAFYSHLYYSAFLVINNYLHFIYLFNIENLLFKLSAWYLDRILMIYPNIFIWYQVSFSTVAIFFVTHKVKKIRNKYRTMPVDD